MPVQRTLFGRPIPHIPPRRVAQLLGGIAVFALLSLVFALPDSIPGPSLSKFTNRHPLSNFISPKKLSSSSILNPFRSAAHAPPIQENSTSGGASWYSNWNWQSPFSSSVTLDENRSLLPPLQKRPAIYTYYDHTTKKDKETKEAEADFLGTWRRAWWAHGFRPVILNAADAMNNPLYEGVQKLELGPEMEVAIARWLAWENMGTGILCDYMALPMGSYEDHLLTYLRRGDFRVLTRYESLGSALFSGGKTEITAALKTALESQILKSSRNVIEAVPADTFAVDSTPEAIAFYDPAVVKAKYNKVDEAITESAPRGWKQLNQLMNAHLHITWQNTFSDGIAVLKPNPAHATALVEPALELATFLSQCPESPIPASCPPNQPKCKTCVASMPLKISTPAQYRNTSSLYSIGTVPHPRTFLSLNALQGEINVAYIRRETARDQWISTITKELLGTGVSTAPRTVKFKEAVASPYGAARSIWFTAEKDVFAELDWHFGFSVPKTYSGTGKSETPVPGPERRPAEPAADPQDGPKADDKEIALERKLLAKAKSALASGKPNVQAVTKASEAWNLADSEAWRFARAWLARSRVERRKWEDEERRYDGVVGGRGGLRRLFQ